MTLLPGKCVVFMTTRVRTWPTFRVWHHLIVEMFSASLCEANINANGETSPVRDSPRLNSMFDRKFQNAL